MARSTPIPAARRAGAPPLGWGAAMTAAFLAALARPSSWVIALAGFLVRGGLVLVFLPIVVVPTTSGFGNLIAPTLIPFVFGQDSPAFATLVLSTFAAVLAWVVASLLLGARIDAALVRDAAEDEELGVTPSDGAGVVVRAALARFVVHLPFLLALSWGAVRIGEAGYRELVLPQDLATPFVLRVMAAVPEAVLVVMIAWMAGEAIGGLVHRRLALGASIGWAIVGALGDVVRRPLSTIATLVLTNAVVLLVVIGPALGAGVVWNELRVALAGGDLPAAVVLLFAFLAVWLTGLVLAGVGAAWRAFAWTLEAYRDVPMGTAQVVPATPAAGTIVPGGPPRHGEWSARDSSGSL